jgi:hypothetical protein
MEGQEPIKKREALSLRERSAGGKADLCGGLRTEPAAGSLEDEVAVRVPHPEG